MKNAIIFITVSFLAVDFSVSIKCHQCDRNNNKKTCRWPESTECKNGNFCVIEIKQRGEYNYNLGCAGPQNSYECGKNSYLCNFCQYDDCNDYPISPIRQPQQCYELYWEDGSQNFTPTIFQNMSKNLTRTFCPRNQNCIEATDDDKKFYYGCAIFKSYDCQKYNFTDCRECESGLCNKPKGYNIKPPPLECFECAESAFEEVFQYISTCKNPRPVVCGDLEKCVRGLGEFKERRYHGCYRDDDDTLREKFGFTNVTFCSKNLCNKIDDPPPPKCYECYEGDDENFKSKPICPYSSQIQCKPGFKCVEASSKNGAIRYHGCADEEKFCNQSDFQVCEYCNGNLCNYVKRLECYKCYSSGINSNGRPTSIPKWFKFGLSCGSVTQTTRCEPNETCVSAYNTDGTRYHGCLLKTDNPNAECSKLGFSHCSVCSQDACNLVNQTEGKKGKHSSALTLTSNRLLIILLFFVLLFSA